MAFTSPEFLILVLAALLAYYLLPKRVQWVILLLASCAFYLAGGIGAMVYLLYTTVTTYIAGRWLGALNQKRQGSQAGAKLKRRKKAIVAVTAAANFGLLFMVKYWDATAQAMDNLTGLALPRLDLLLPLGLSFYMFQSMGYVIDCYRGKYPPQRNIAKYALFASFFPQMVQGPISRFNQLGPQLTQPHPFDADQVKYGIQLAMWGYLKKLVIADRAAVVVNTVFQTPENYGGAMTAIAVGFYCVQLYCDFSGGIDITRGVAQLFGIDLAENFRRPVFAVSLTDYWRRWHITLGSWMKDYVFYPISLSKPFARLGKFTRRRIGGRLGKIIPTSLATFLVYFIIGIWHGANFRYIAFGLWNGVLITGALLLAGPFVRLRTRLHIAENSKWLHGFRLVRTMLLVFIGRYITRAPRLLVALDMLYTTVASPCLYQLRDGTLLRLGLQATDLAVIAVGVAAVLVVEFLQERGMQVRKSLEKQNPFLQWLCILLPLLILLFLGILRDAAISSEFIYKQF